MTATFIQWNCRGLLTNLDDIEYLLQEHQPAALCIQETHLNPTQTNFLRNFNVFRNDRHSASISSGGVAVVVPRLSACTLIPLKTPLEAVAVRLLVHKAISVCSLYLSPSQTITTADLHALIDQLPEPFLLMGDFNAHNTLWGGNRIDVRGKLIESVLTSRSLCLFNTGTSTYFNASSLSSTSIDLSICSASLLSEFSWSVVPNPYGSDHFPIVLKSTVPFKSLQARTPRWKLEKADWANFEKDSELHQDALTGLDINDACELLTHVIVEAAHHSIPKTSGRLPSKPKPWWNDECSEARKRQNCAWTVVRRYPTVENVIKFKKLRAKARYVRRQSKKNTWMGYASSINSATGVKVVWDKVHRIKGDYRAFAIPLFTLDGNSAPTLEQQANILGEHFQSVSGSEHYSHTFLKYKAAREKVRIKCTGGSKGPSL